jgi:hypothetical protein
MGDIIYYIVLVLFVYMSFGIIKSYYKSKFDADGRRKDMIDKEENDN